MLYTSAEAAKLLRKLNDELENLEAMENQSCTFRASVGENIEDVRPEYDYFETQNKIIEIEEKIRKVKHEINKFNLENEIPDFKMTIDQMLIYIPQLTKKKQKLFNMQNRLPKRRESVSNSGIIDYSYANYDIKNAKEDYIKISDELSKAQTALDVINNKLKMEIDL